MMLRSCTLMGCDTSSTTTATSDFSSAVEVRSDA